MKKIFLVFLLFLFKAPALHSAASSNPNILEQATYKTPILEAVAKIVRFHFMCCSIKEVNDLIMLLFHHLANDHIFSQEDYQIAHQRYQMYNTLAHPHMKVSQSKEFWTNDFFIALCVLNKILPAIKKFWEDYNQSSDKSMPKKGEPFFENLEEMKTLVTKIGNSFVQAHNEIKAERSRQIVV